MPKRASHGEFHDDVLEAAAISAKRRQSEAAPPV